MKTFSCKLTVIRAGFQWDLKFLRNIFENKLKYQILSNSVQWEPSCSMPTDRRTEEGTDKQTDRHDEADTRFSSSRS